MLHAYSKRLLSPFTGQVQIVESNRARALTLGGDKWEIQFKYAFRTDERSQGMPPGSEMRHSYVRVAIVGQSGIERIPGHAYLDADAVEGQVQELAEYLGDVSLPLPPADLHEYWLLDGMDEQPLALIYSCVHAEEMPMFPHRPEWTATPASIMEVRKLPEEEQHYYVPPVNYRLEQLVTERAGKRPRARWIKRREGLTETFPACLVREDWENEEDRRLCQRYIERQAPRLLMLHGLSRDDRLRLEGYARQNSLEVARFFHLYPEVADEEVMSAIRVEARLRLAAGEAKA
jgi:hypothetical protein